MHFIGDVHSGLCQPWRFDAVISDFKRNRLPKPLFHLQIGDNTDTGSTSPTTEDATFQAFMARLPVATKYWTAGNHDINSVRSIAQWCAANGYASQNNFYDLPLGAPQFRLIVIAPDGLYNILNPEHYSQAALDFLDAALGGTTLPCVVATHYPLWNTVLGDVNVDNKSTDAQFWIYSDAHPSDSTDVLNVLGRHSNMKLWVCGHTHSHLFVPGLMMKITTGVATFASLNISSMWYQGDRVSGIAGAPVHNCHTCFVTWYPSGKVEARFRDHGAGQWVAPLGAPAVTVAGL